MSDADLEHRELLAEAAMGDAADRFVESDLGQVLLGMARAQRDEALEQLSRTAFWRWRRIMQLQNEARRAVDFENWLRELINSGVQAMLRLEEPADE